MPTGSAGVGRPGTLGRTGPPPKPRSPPTRIAPRPTMRIPPALAQIGLRPFAGHSRIRNGVAHTARPRLLPLAHLAAQAATRVLAFHFPDIATAERGRSRLLWRARRHRTRPTCRHHGHHSTSRTTPGHTANS